MNRSLHRLALLTALATLVLIFVGGMVTSKQAGLSVPDWPSVYGYNMFLFPYRLWQGGIFFEHVHRLAASGVGFLSILLVILAWWKEPRGWVRWLSVAVLGMVIFQGVLGGLRVVLVNVDLAVVHACVAQAFFCLVVFFCIVTSRWWREAPHESGSGIGNGLIPLAIVCVLTIYLQLMVAAVMRHFHAGLAIPDVPRTYGRWLPPTDGSQLASANALRAKIDLEPVSLGQVWLAFTHRIGACVVFAELATLIALVLAKYRDQPKVFRPAVAIAGLLTAQITLGILTVLGRKPPDIASAHVACGALLLAATLLLTVRSMRLYSRSLWRTGRKRLWPNKSKVGLGVLESVSA